MDMKFVIFILITYTRHTFSQISKCSDAPPNACGPLAICLDDLPDTINLNINGPYCKCSDNSYGSPPNCKLKCLYDSDCNSSEFCDYTGSKECIEGCRANSCKIGQHCDFGTRRCTDGCKINQNCDFDEFCDEKVKKCLKICNENSCGINGKCLAKYHTKYCSCVAGWVLDSAAKSCRPQNTTDDIQKCENSCNAPSKCSELDGIIYCSCPATPEANPFESCPPGYSHFPGQPQPFKPTTESQVFSLQTVMILTG